ncbi:hypothetical protein EDD86DRAFT_60561 [Gorgonomyces haynaldii]|nr:hypothetical protein EDD86DRAFT_60561 [Gorgonomyces haynaldii]
MDILQRNGNYPLPPGVSEILGVEFGGEVVEPKGSFQKGDRVFGLVPGGCYAEYVTIDQDLAMKIPPELSFSQAAALPEAWFTALQAMIKICQFQAGENILIHAGASGVGTAAIQIAKLVGAKNIIVTCGSAEKQAFCKSLGATHAINYKEDTAFSKLVLEATDKKGVDVLIDFVGAPYWNENLQSLALDGRMVMLAFLGGAVVKESNLGVILRKRLQINGSTLRSRTPAYHKELKQLFETMLLPSIVKGDLKAVIDRELDWNQIVLAHELMEQNQNSGKIVMTIN